MALANITTTVVNTSGVRRYFDFLPPIGLYLNSGEEFTHAGSITEWLRTKGSGPAREKMIQGLNYCLDKGYLEIKNGPAPIFFDVTADASVEIGVDNGSVVLGPPASTITTQPPTTAPPTTTAAPTTT